ARVRSKKEWENVKCMLPEWTELVLGYFFFSRRRRHTRSKRDWSSDVCSSDLRFPANRASTYELYSTAHNRNARRMASLCCGDMRSEERRVGKEGRPRMARYY